MKKLGKTLILFSSGDVGGADGGDVVLVACGDGGDCGYGGGGQVMVLAMEVKGEGRLFFSCAKIPTNLSVNDQISSRE